MPSNKHRSIYAERYTTARTKVLNCSLMKKLILNAIVISLVSSGSKVFAQVHVNMETDVPGVIVAPIYGPDGITPLGGDALAQLIGSYNDPQSALVPGSLAYPLLSGFVHRFGLPLGGPVDETFNSMPSNTTVAPLEMV